MKVPDLKPQRCAIYTRKSTEHNLDLAFNSLDAQREACEAYIKSQAHEGWRLSPGRFDDGGLSGASLERAALQMLLEQVRLRRIEIIVVYKVDRLTRSLADFAKLVELFDAHGVSFVSVTQSFNTTSSMGRLTLNVLLSFAQFEREVIGERVRDKIAASKRKGIWVGGPIPLGYCSQKKVLHVVPAEAGTVQAIFNLYLAKGSVGRLVAELDRVGITSRCGCRFGIGALRHLLRNRFYIGEVVYRGETHLGPQEPIVDRAIFQAVQDRLDEQAVARRKRLAETSGLLTGLLYDDRGNRLTPSHANKRGLRYRYYVSQAVLQNKKEAVGCVSRIEATELEATVVKAIRTNLALDPSVSDRHTIETHVETVHIKPGRIDIALRTDGEQSESQISIPWEPRSARRKKGVHRTASTGRSDASRGQLLLAIAKSRRWMQDIANDRDTFESIAAREGCGERHVRFLAPLAFVSPALVEAIDTGCAPSHLTITELARNLPHAWATQNARHLR